MTEEIPNKLRSLVCFYACKPNEWIQNLPEQSDFSTYKAHGTPLSSSSPLFAVTYELWYSLNHTTIDRDYIKFVSLAQLRMLLEIIWDAGTVRHVDWDVGNAYRWDDYWTLVHRLAMESCESLGWVQFCAKKFDLYTHLGIVYVERD